MTNKIERLPSQLQAQTIALAGLVQAAHLVDAIARTGSCDSRAYHASMNSLFVFDAPSALDIYGDSSGIAQGLRVLLDLLRGEKTDAMRSVMRYSLAIIYIQSKLRKRADLLEIIHNRLLHAQKKSEHFNSDINGIASSVAAIYQDTISTFRYRIQVSGAINHLQNTHNADKIRALLLAGIRAAVLWQQSGGKRWHLLLKRAQLNRSARLLLEH